MLVRIFGLAALFSWAIPASAQTSPPPGVDEPTITMKNSQPSQQLLKDRYECYGWAKKQTGYDPSVAAGLGRNEYRRAFTACMDGRGYSVTYGPSSAVPAVPAAPPQPPPPQRQPTFATRYFGGPPELGYRPFHFQVEGGYTVTTGSTGDNFNDGGNVGLGVSWFPSPSLPVGLRVDGSWSRFDAHNAYYDESGDSFTHSHMNVYGGDVDLQLNLAHPSSQYQFYLLGGAGWYREQTVLEQLEPGCGYYCGPYLAGEQRSTTPWRSAWNAGIGGEFALPGGSSFFVEARYLRIGSHDNDIGFVPIRVGLRF